MLKELIKICVLVGIMVLLVSCMPQPDRSRMLFIENRDYITTRDSTNWYITNLDELKNLYHSHQYSYAGSIDNYHLIAWATKLAYYPDQCDHFAIPKEQFTPVNEFNYYERIWWPLRTYPDSSR
jgi:hypothetical protein